MKTAKREDLLPHCPPSEGHGLPLNGTQSGPPLAWTLKGRTFRASEPTGDNMPLNTWWRGHEMPGSQVQGQEAGSQGPPWQARPTRWTAGCPVPNERTGFAGPPARPPQNLWLLTSRSPQFQRDGNCHHYDLSEVWTPY